MVCGSTPIDVTVRDEGTLFLFRPITEAGREWIASNVQDDATWFAGALVVEHRYATDLYHGMVNDGLAVGEG